MTFPKTPTDWTSRLNAYGASATPCFFLIDFEMKQPRCWAIDQLGGTGVNFSFPRLPDAATSFSPPVELYPIPIPRERFATAYSLVQAGLQRGDSFLANLTFPTPVALAGTLRDVYLQSRAKYRVLLPGRFVSFSPETFVTISATGYIESRPMKGTAENTAHAREQLLNSPKEIAEHATIVDLIRNDLSRVARRVRVTDYRYLETIGTAGGELLQTSSAIGGSLAPGWSSRMGDILAELLPAGSVSGAPKSATLELIRRAEGEDRGYYCGIAGYFDGECLDTCVLIRYIEQRPGGYVFRSGGGITARSQEEAEYQELNDKIRIPRFGALPDSVPLFTH
ncbi:para-aminobenzoate synthetase component 1 [Lewinella aquimaris]|uniref:Para-aminobenzoate synthetase component 1 n=1 Tax=Neolewinella aquimaris TaxID=1835722 RepID=A0A840DY13_9BACT|nr:aminodeoxychorismate synthase component I [Neolewinella aquimaris]MBB4077820.1 para-aminobenzoate synthetase component 1 [Neolewinella aquimaris]